MHCLLVELSMGLSAANSQCHVYLYTEMCYSWYFVQRWQVGSLRYCWMLLVGLFTGHAHTGTSYGTKRRFPTQVGNNSWEPGMGEVRTKLNSSITSGIIHTRGNKVYRHTLHRHRLWPQLRSFSRKYCVGPWPLMFACACPVYGPKMEGKGKEKERKTTPSLCHYNCYNFYVALLL